MSLTIIHLGTGFEFTSQVFNIQGLIFSELYLSQRSINWKRESLRQRSSESWSHVTGEFDTCQRGQPSCLEDTWNPKSYIGISLAQSQLFCTNCESLNLLTSNLWPDKMGCKRTGFSRKDFCFSVALTNSIGSLGRWWAANFSLESHQFVSSLFNAEILANLLS